MRHFFYIKQFIVLLVFVVLKFFTLIFIEAIDIFLKVFINFIVLIKNID